MREGECATKTEDRSPVSRLASGDGGRALGSPEKLTRRGHEGAKKGHNWPEIGLKMVLKCQTKSLTLLKKLSGLQSCK